MKSFSQLKKNIKNQNTFGYSGSLTEENSSKHSPRSKELFVITNPKYLNANVLDRNTSTNSNIYTTDPSSVFQSITNRSPNTSNVYITELNYKTNSNKKRKNTFLSMKTSQFDQYKTFKKRHFKFLPPINNNNNPKNEELGYLDTYNCRYLKSLLQTTKTEPTLPEFESISSNNKSNLLNTQKVSIKKPSQRRARITVRDSNLDYITKTNEINLLRYKTDIQKKAIKKYEENLQNQKDILDNSIKFCQNFIINYNEKFLVNFNKQLRLLNKRVFNLKFEDDNLINKIIKLKNEIQDISFGIIKTNEAKNIYDRWADLLSLLIGEKTTKKNSRNSRIKEFAISNVEDLDKIFETKKLININLLNVLDEVNQQKNILNKEYNDLLSEISEDDFRLIKECQIKEQQLKELKQRNDELISIRKQIKINKRNSVDLSNKTIVVNSSNIYDKISEIYSFVLDFDDIVIIKPDFKRNIAEIKNCLEKNKKALLQLKILETVFLNYSDLLNIVNLDEKDKAIIKDIKMRMELRRRKFAAIKKKKEDEENLIKMKENMIMRVHRVNYKPNHKVDNVPDFYRKRFNKSENRKNIKKEGKITFFDFFYDVIEETNDKNNKNKKK